MKQKKSNRGQNDQRTKEQNEEKTTTKIQTIKNKMTPKTEQ